MKRVADQVDLKAVAEGLDDSLPSMRAATALGLLANENDRLHAALAESRRPHLTDWILGTALIAVVCAATAVRVHSDDFDADRAQVVAAAKAEFARQRRADGEDHVFYLTPPIASTDH